MYKSLSPHLFHEMPLYLMETKGQNHGYTFNSTYQNAHGTQIPGSLKLLVLN